MPEAIHPYLQIPLFTTGLIVGIWLIVLHVIMLAKADKVKETLVKLPRNYQAGTIVLGIGMFWFWLLMAPKGMEGPFAWLGSLSTDIGEFEPMKKWLRLIIPVTYFAMVFYVKEFLFVRGLGLLCLVAAAPLLGSAMLKDPSSRLLIPIFAYLMITKGLFWVGMPYLFRDAVNWVVAEPKRYTAACFGGLIYGIATLTCAFLFWRGY